MNSTLTTQIQQMTADFFLLTTDDTDFTDLLLSVAKLIRVLRVFRNQDSAVIRQNPRQCVSILYFNASLETRCRENSPATAFLRVGSGRNTILWPVIIVAGKKSLACMVSAV